MAICQIYYHPELDEQQWAKLDQDVRATGPVPAEGGHLVVAGRADGRWCVITVWDSEEARDRFFSERLAPAYERAGLSLAGVANGSPRSSRIGASSTGTARR